MHYLDRINQLTGIVLLPAAVLAACLWLPCVRFASAAPAALGLAGLVALYSRFMIRRIQTMREERCLLDEQLIQSQKLAAMGELSSGIAHEINTPLAIIFQESEWIRHLQKKLHADSPETLQELGDSVEQILAQVERCKRITHGMLNFARKHDAVDQETDLNRLLEDMVIWVEKDATQRNIAILRAYAPDLPMIFTDAPLLRQVVLNLLNNAAQAVDKDGTISVATYRAGHDLVAIEVRDSGCGIAQENLDKIFNPFFTTKEPGKGTGLGLSISLAIVTRLGGTIKAASRPGEFTSFVVTLPVQRRESCPTWIG